MALATEQSQVQHFYEPDLAPGEDSWSPSARERALAWSAHLFTASGAVWGLLSILAIARGAWIEVFWWMAAAVFVDSFDGFLARRVRVKTVLPEFDGALLDNMVDFLNYVFVPAFFLAQSDLIPTGFGTAAAVVIMMASSYQFCQDDAKTEDHYFKGFPSYWNIMVYYLFILGLSGWANLAITLILAALVFVPIKYIYPSRTAAFQGLNMAMAGTWGVVNLTILLNHPNHAPWLIWASLAFAVYYVGMSLYAMYWGRQRV
jgi:phosphatidylcholine synthase